MNWFITAEDLRKLEPAPLIFDLRFRLADLAYHDRVYAEGHIPGAFLVDFERDLSDPKGDFGGDHPFYSRKPLPIFWKSTAPGTTAYWCFTMIPR